MAARRIIHLAVDVGLGAAVTADWSRELSESDVRLIRADQTVLRLSFWTTANSGQNYVPFTFAAGTSFKFGIKDPASVTGTSFLAYADGTSWNDTADWDQVAPESGRCCVRVSTDTTALTSFLSSSGTDARKAIAEIEVNEPGGAPYTLARFWVNCFNDVIRGTEGDPAPSSPTYATLAQLNAVVCPGLTFIRQGNSVSLCIDGVPTQTWELPT